MHFVKRIGNIGLKIYYHGTIFERISLLVIVGLIILMASNLYLSYNLVKLNHEDANSGVKNIGLVSETEELRLNSVINQPKFKLREQKAIPVVSFTAQENNVSSTKAEKIISSELQREEVMEFYSEESLELNRKQQELILQNEGPTKSKTWFDITAWLDDFDTEKYQNTVADELKPFTPVLTSELRNKTQVRYKDLLTLWEIFAGAAIESNIIYFLYSGSLIGVYRHHGLIPWDDDIDVLVHKGQKATLKIALSSLPNYVLHDSPTESWKFFHIPDYWGKPPAENELWWPFIEIYFFDENMTHIWDETTHWQGSYFHKSDVLPFQRRLFLGQLVRVPCDMRAIVMENFSLTDCVSPHFHHIGANQTILAPVTTNCKNLKPYFPFVEYRFDGKVFTEVLKLNETVLSEIQVEPFC